MRSDCASNLEELIYPINTLPSHCGDIMPASITIFDGVNCIGGNKIYVEFDGSGAFFDFGTNYKKIADFYEEFPQSIIALRIAALIGEATTGIFVSSKPILPAWSIWACDSNTASAFRLSAEDKFTSPGTRSFL